MSNRPSPATPDLWSKPAPYQDKDDDDDDDQDDDDDGVYLKPVNINLRANLQILKSVNLKCL